MEKMNGESMNLLNENIEKLKALFPEIVTDGKIDFDMLKTLLGEEVDASNEKYFVVRLQTWFLFDRRPCCKNGLSRIWNESDDRKRTSGR